MKSIMIIAMAFFSVFLQAADNRQESPLLRGAREVVASEDRQRIHISLAELSNQSKHPDLSKAMHLLLEAEIDPNAVVNFSDGLNYTALSRAAIELAEPNIHILREWSEEHEDGIDPNAGGSYTPLTAAVSGRSPRFENNKKAILEALLCFKGIDVNRADTNGDKPLYLAVEKVLNLQVLHFLEPLFTKYLSYVALLVQHGAQVTEELLVRVATAREQQKVTHNQYDRIMAVLSTGCSVKSASSKG